MANIKYRLYINNGNGYENAICNNSIEKVFSTLDNCLLKKNSPYSRYIVIEGNNELGDAPIMLFWGFQKEEYLEHKNKVKLKKR
jgi:hypothetical protein